jgi:hypothetical protein
MRRPLVTAAILIAFGLATASAQDNKAAASPEASKAPPTTSEQQKGEQAVGSKSGQNGKEEPGSHSPTDAKPEPVFVNGALNVPGAPADSQTVPAKFSQRNDALDHMPIMAMGALALTDEQKKAIVAGVKLANRPVQSTAAKPAEELPWTVTVHDLGVSANDKALAGLGYVRTQDRILLVDAPNRIVIGEIKN